MHTQEIACPNCNGRMWANVPDPSGESGMSALLGFTDASTRCPHCRKLVCVRVGSDGGIRNIFIQAEDCLLTTACCTVRGLPDDCDELKSARALRDSWLVYQPSGKQIISSYYRVAPRILSALRRNLSEATYTELLWLAFTDYIAPSADAWHRNNAAEAFKLLRKMVEDMAADAGLDLRETIEGDQSLTFGEIENCLTTQSSGRGKPRR